MKLNNYPDLIEKGLNFEQNRLLFDFEYIGIQFKCLLFVEINTVLLSIVSENIGYLISLDSYGNFNGKLPSEFYYSIRKKLIKETGKDNITQLWIAFDLYIEQISIDRIREVPEERIISFLKTTKTSDSKYDKEGDKPFFETWVRNGKKGKVSIDNLFKIEKYFGREVSNACRLNNISSRWKEYPTSKSLDFLNLKKTNSNIESLK